MLCWAVLCSCVLCCAGGTGTPPDAQGSSILGSNILLTQDFVAAARGLSEALAALLPSAAALADADPGQGAAAAAAATEAVQGLKCLQGRMASARAAAGRRSSEGGSADQRGSAGGAGIGAGATAGADTSSAPVQIQRSVGEGVPAPAAASGLMGPPPARPPAQAADAAAESAFARQQQFAFSPPSTDAPIRSAALPVPILGPRRSYDAPSGNDPWRSQMSWTSRPRAVSASGQGDTAMGASSFDSMNMSMPRRSLDDSGFARDALAAALRQHSPQDQQMQGAAGAGALVPPGAAAAGTSEGSGAGAQPAPGVAGPWGGEPMLLRQPSRRKSMEGSRPSLEERRQQ